MSKVSTFDTMVSFLDITCPQGEDVDLDEADKGISECEAMLQYSLDELQFQPESEQWKEEVAFWRRILQESKKTKRRMLATA